MGEESKPRINIGDIFALNNNIDDAVSIMTIDDKNGDETFSGPESIVIIEFLANIPPLTFTRQDLIEGNITLEHSMNGNGEKLRVIGPGQYHLVLTEKHIEIIQDGMGVVIPPSAAVV